jgi:hypothetical protein
VQSLPWQQPLQLVGPHTYVEPASLVVDPASVPDDAVTQPWSAVHDAIAAAQVRTSADQLAHELAQPGAGCPQTLATCAHASSHDAALVPVPLVPVALVPLVPLVPVPLVPEVSELEHAARRKNAVVVQAKSFMTLSLPWEPAASQRQRARVFLRLSQKVAKVSRARPSKGAKDITFGQRPG